MSDIKLFVDSGAHSLYTREIMSKGLRAEGYEYYETDAFWEYVDSYAEFIKKNEHLIDTYVNIDVIFNNELSWKVQKYLEDQHGLHPLPVLHSSRSGDMMKWLKIYLDNYEYIGMEGLGQQSTKAQWMNNLGDPVFSKICTKPSYLPTHKIHGFAMTSPDLLARYPWYSVDSTSWIQFGKYGAVVIPRKNKDTYDYSKSPFITFVTSREAKKGHQAHFDNYVDIHQEYFYNYFEEKGFIIGSSTFRTVDPNGYKCAENEHWADRKEGLVETIIEPGISNSHELRDQLNIQFYLDLEANLPPWPWAWIPKVRHTRLF